MNLTVVINSLSDKRSKLGLHDKWMAQFGKRAMTAGLFAIVFMYFRLKLNNGPAQFAR